MEDPLPHNPFPFAGLDDAAVRSARKAHGTNALEAREHSGLIKAVLATVSEPMFVLLIAASTVYFLLGGHDEGFFLLGATLLVGAISFYQDQRSRRALEALSRFTQARAVVIRNGRVVDLPAEEIVVGDHVVVKEGELVPADGVITHANDFAVNESILTGEAFSVDKGIGEGRRGRAYRGTQAVSGLAVVLVTEVGLSTEVGRIGISLVGIGRERSPLEAQIALFVRVMAIVGIGFFLLVWGLNYHRTGDLLDSLLKGLTLAMSILPEEIPVAFTTFMALGAWRLMKLGVLVKQARMVEALGAATVICTDKTGTITENRMALVFVHPHGGEPLPPGTWTTDTARHLIITAMWASEPVPFDPMELALHEAYAQLSDADLRPLHHMVHEYPIGGKPPMMTHVFADENGNRVVAAKGAPEAILACCGLVSAERAALMAQVHDLARDGHRVLAVAEADPPDGPYPAQQQQLPFRYLGLVAFHDPPKHNITHVLDRFAEAGIRVNMLTGDNAMTAKAIARQVGFRDGARDLDGDTVLSMSEAELDAALRQTTLFTRMFPEAKLRVVNALKAQGHVVAMTGDGVNDGPALKAAHIGVAMGRRGSELAKEAAALVLLDDDLERMVDAVAVGRRIYGNLKKAIRYIISIHLPIILIVSLPLLLGWVYPNLFTPVHVIFLELLMGPTCSIAYENEPLEPGAMSRPPRRMRLTFLSWIELRTSLVQGLVITAGVLLCYRYGVHHSLGEDGTRTLVFTALVVANIALTLVDRSFEQGVLRTLRYPNSLLRGIVGGTVLLLVLLLSVPLLREFFHLATVAPRHLGVAVGMGLASVLWYEGVKLWRRRTGNSRSNR